MTTPSKRIVVAIPTFKRPEGLLRTLHSLNKLDTHHDVSVMIGDNDPTSASTRETAVALSTQGYNWPIEYIAVPERGISQVRNALIKAAIAVDASDFIAMIDDDQVVAPDWLNQLTNLARKENADIVGNRKMPLYEGDEPSWAKHLQIYQPLDRPEGLCKNINSTSGVLLSIPYLKKIAPNWFDDYFALVGGGDKEFFTRQVKAGAIFAYAPGAVAWEVYYPDRLTAEWARSRSFRIGSSDMRNVLKHGTKFTVVVETFKAMTAIAVAIFANLGAQDSDDKFVRSLRLDRAKGKLHALTNQNVQEYSRTFGK